MASLTGRRSIAYDYHCGYGLSMTHVKVNSVCGESNFLLASSALGEERLSEIAHDNEPTTSARPVAGSDRLIALDVLRGFALLGILLMNIIAFGHGFMIYAAPITYSDWNTTDVFVWGFNAVFSDGTMRILFATLFGAGVALLCDRLGERFDAKRVRALYYRRILFLMAFGLADAYLLLWAGDILFFYGACGLLLYFFRNRSVKTLVIWGSVIWIMGAALNASLSGFVEGQIPEYEVAVAAKTAGEQLDAEQQSLIDQLEIILENDVPNSELLQVERAARLGTYAENFAWNAPYATMFAVTGGGGTVLFDIFWCMIFGIALYRMGILQGERPTRFYGMLAVGGYAIGLLFRVPAALYGYKNGFEPMAMLDAMVAFTPGRTAIGIGHFGLVMWVLKKKLFKHITDLLSDVGRMAFTNYILQTLMCGFLFWGIGLGLMGATSRLELYYFVAGMWAVSIFFSHAWLKRFRYGPLEWVWRSLTYGKMPALKR